MLQESIKEEADVVSPSKPATYHDTSSDGKHHAAASTRPRSHDLLFGGWVPACPRGCHLLGVMYGRSGAVA